MEVETDQKQDSNKNVFKRGNDGKLECILSHSSNDDTYTMHIKIESGTFITKLYDIHTKKQFIFDMDHIINNISLCKNIDIHFGEKCCIDDIINSDDSSDDFRDDSSDDYSDDSSNSNSSDNDNHPVFKDHIKATQPRCHILISNEYNKKESYLLWNNVFIVERVSCPGDESMNIVNFIVSILNDAYFHNNAMIEERILHNITTIVKVNFKVSLDRLAKKYPTFIKYNPTEFAGAVIKINKCRDIFIERQNNNTTLLCFDMGQMIMVGCQSVNEVMNVSNFLFPILQTCNHDDEMFIDEGNMDIDELMKLADIYKDL